MRNTTKDVRNIAFGLLMSLVLFTTGTAANAETAPDSFRERVVTASLVCYGVFSRLAVEEWPGRDYAEVEELRLDARQKRDFTMTVINRYTAAYDGFDLDSELAKADEAAGTYSMSKERLLDMGIYCEDQLYALADEEERNGYTP